FRRVLFRSKGEFIAVESCVILFIEAESPLQSPYIAEGMGIVEFVGIAHEAPGIAKVPVRTCDRGPIRQIVLRLPLNRGAGARVGIDLASRSVARGTAWD